MKNIFAYSILFAFCGLFACKKDVDPVAADIRGGGFSLYWAHTASYTEGRYTLFSISSDRRSYHRYKLDFDVSVNGSKITALLKKVNDGGKCPEFPIGGWPGSDGLCSAEGRFNLPDAQLQPGKYTFEIQTGIKTIVSEIEVATIKRVIQPISGGLSVPTPEIYAVPENILYGSVSYKGSDLTPNVQKFFQDLENQGLTPTTVENHPYAFFNPDKKHLEEESYAEDNHSITILCKMNGSFLSVTELAKQYFEKSDRRLNFGLYSTNGDEAHLNQYDGIKIFERK